MTTQADEVSIWAWAWHRTGAAREHLLFWIFETVMPAVITAVTFLSLSDDASDAAKVIVPAAALVIAILVGLALIYLTFLFLAPISQRNEARVRLKELSVPVPDTATHITNLEGGVRYTSGQNRFPYAGVRVTVANGPGRRMRGRLIGVSGQGAPAGLLQWSAYDNGTTETDIDTEAWLDVVTLEHPNWVTIIYGNPVLREPNRLYHIDEAEFIFVLAFGGDNCSPVEKRFRLSVTGPRRTVRGDVETVWMFPGWLPEITFEAIEDD